MPRHFVQRPRGHRPWRRPRAGTQLCARARPAGCQGGRRDLAVGEEGGEMKATRPASTAPIRRFPNGLGAVT